MDPIFFLHIPKTAGTSVRKMVETRFAHSRRLLILDDEDLNVGLPNLDRFDMVSGHLSFGLAANFHSKPFIMTWLRDPIERALSTFYYLRTLSDVELQQHLGPQPSNLLQSLREDTLEQFIGAHMDFARKDLGQRQTADLSRSGAFFDYKEELSAKALEQAKNSLASIQFVGIVEKFEESMALLFYLLGWELPDEMLFANQNRSRPSTCSHDSATIELLNQICRDDIELYQFANQLFAQRWHQAVHEMVAHSASKQGLESNKPVPEKVRYSFEFGLPRSGWHEPEFFDHHWVCWSGPSPESWIEFEVRTDTDLQITMHILACYDHSIVQNMELSVNGHTLSRSLAQEPGREDVSVHAIIPKALISVRNRLKLQIKLPDVVCPSNLGTGADQRAVGICVDQFLIEPAGMANRIASLSFPSAVLQLLKRTHQANIFKRSSDV